MCLSSHSSEGWNPGSATVGANTFNLATVGAAISKTAWIPACAGMTVTLIYGM